MEDSEHSVNVFHIADGLTADIDKLLGAFVKSGSIRYESFVEIWKEMKFNHLFEGRPSFAELREFAEEALHIGKTYLTNLNNSLVMRVGALYMLYGMAYTQPLPHYSKIRIVASDCLPIEQLIVWSREQQHYDVLYVWGRMLIDGVVQFHLTEREYGAEKSLRKYYDVGKSFTYARSKVNQCEYSVLSDLLEGARVTGVAEKGEAVASDDLPVSWSDLDKLAKEYHEEKCQLKALSNVAASKDPPLGLNYADPNLPTSLLESIQSLLQNTDVSADKGSTYGDLQERRTEIKKRGASAKIVQPQHHISSIDIPTTSNMETQSKSKKECGNAENIPEVESVQQISIAEGNQEIIGGESDEDIVYVIEVQEEANEWNRSKRKKESHAERKNRLLGIVPDDCVE